MQDSADFIYSPIIFTSTYLHISEMDDGPLTCSKPTNQIISSPDSNDADELDNFVLHIDEIDMKNSDNSDNESNDDRLHDNKFDVSNLKDSDSKKLCLKGNVSLSSEENMNRININLKDSRFSNHDRLKQESKQSELDSNEDDLLGLDSKANKSEPQSNENSIRHCSTEKTESLSLNKDSDMENSDVKCRNKSPVKDLSQTCEQNNIENCETIEGRFKISENKEDIPQKIEKELSGSKNSLTITEDINEVSEFKDDEFESVDKELNSLLTSEEDGGTDSKSNKTDVKDNSVASENNTTHNLLKESSPSSANNVSQEETSVNPTSTKFNDELKKSNNLPEEGNQDDSKNNESGLLTKMIVRNDSENSITAVNEDNQVGHNGEIDAMDHDDSQGSCELSQNESKCIAAPSSVNKKNTEANSLKRLADDGNANCIKKPKIKDPEDEACMETKLVNGFSLKRKPDGTNEDEVDVKKSKSITYENINGEQTTDDVNKNSDSSEPRKRLIDGYKRGEKRYNIDREELDALVMLKVVEYLNNTSEVGDLRNKLKFAVSEQMRQAKQVNALKKQIEDARIIIRKLIEEKNAKKSWTDYAVPLKVTRSVGLQVCTCGTVNMSNSKSKDKESVRQLLHLDKNGETSNVEEKKDSEQKKKDSSDDVVIVKESVASNSNQEATKAIPPETRNASPATEQMVSAVDKVRTKTNSSPKNEVNSSPAGTPSEHVFAKPSLAAGANKKRLSGEISQNNTNAQNQVTVEATIDLTDNEDGPAETGAAASQSAKLASPGVSVKPSTVLYPPEKLVNSAVKGSPKNSSPVPESSGVKTSPGPAAQTSRKSTTMTPNMLKRNPTFSTIGTDLYTSCEKLPKFPSCPNYPANVVRPPRPSLKIGKHSSGKQGIMLSWNFEPGKNPDNIEEYQLYAFQESKDGVRDKNDTWKKVGDIKALPLPMACFLTQFVEGHKYHFVVRAVDKEKILGEFSPPGSIILKSAAAAAATTPPAK